MIKKLYVLFLLLVFVTSSVYSYIDPGTGSYLVQVLIAVFVGASVGIKVFWRRIKEFFTGKKTELPEVKEDDDDDDEDETQQLPGDKSKS